ncbi:hypothetical protein KP79_PYT18816 [Mizuhopecten yessoensis]|uniref:Uncharacterized protein n=1 Tax=Mizuhopecten yessoensis TaxID=6573 RepID=A0A210Q3E8_MIZYE|nr:hypothetical protein KP79_PYT18816 [Mizuhopecten yessoensis]
MGVFPSSNWCVFNKTVRTNNDVEGWHHRLNIRVNVRGPVTFYLLIQELFRKAEAITLEALPAGEANIKTFMEERFPCSLKCSVGCELC